jgi:hypothetical protein
MSAAPPRVGLTQALGIPMKLVIKLVLVLSGLGTISSLFVHIASLPGIDLNLGTSVFVLHIGIFVVWLPTEPLNKSLELWSD